MTNLDSIYVLQAFCFTATAVLCSINYYLSKEVRAQAKLINMLVGFYKEWLELGRKVVEERERDRTP